MKQYKGYAHAGTIELTVNARYINIELLNMGLWQDRNRRAFVDRIPEFVHILVGERDTTVGPVEARRFRGGFGAPGIFCAVDHDVVARIDIIFLRASDIDGIRI